MPKSHMFGRSKSVQIRCRRQVAPTPPHQYRNFTRPSDRFYFLAPGSDLRPLFWRESQNATPGHRAAFCLRSRSGNPRGLLVYFRLMCSARKSLGHLSFPRLPLEFRLGFEVEGALTFLRCSLNSRFIISDVEFSPVKPVIRDFLSNGIRCTGTRARALLQS